MSKIEIWLLKLVVFKVRSLEKKFRLPVPTGKNRFENSTDKF
jgi:hypothetical protein